MKKIFLVLFVCSSLLLKVSSQGVVEQLGEYGFTVGAHLTKGLLVCKSFISFFAPKKKEVIEALRSTALMGLALSRDLLLG